MLFRSIKKFFIKSASNSFFISLKIVTLVWADESNDTVPKLNNVPRPFFIELYTCASISKATPMSMSCALRPSSTCSRWCLTSCAARSMWTGTAILPPFLPIFWNSLKRKSATNSARSLSLIRATTTTSTACPPRNTDRFPA